jgi:poly(A) polymerase
MSPARRHEVPFPLRRLDRRAVDIVRRLNEDGFEAYLVGGCVRDHLLGMTPKDYDIATSARPGQVRRLFRRSRIIGRRFKIVHVYAGREIYEVSTFRRVPKQGKGEITAPIRDDNAFGTAEEDALRRDFSVNGLFLNPGAHEIVDFVGGMEDLEKRQLISIGPPDLRFREDPVRILRLIKFMRRLHLSAGPEEVEATRTHAQLLRQSAEPRVVEEVFRLMQTGDMEGVWADLCALDLVSILLPDIAGWLRSDPDSPSREQRMSTLFRCMDDWILDGGEPGYGFRLAVLYGAWAEAEWSPESQCLGLRDPRHAPVALLQVLQLRARFPRAAITRGVHILQAQLDLDPDAGSSKSRRRKRGWQERLLAQDEFPEALEFLRCRLVAADRDLAPYDEWHELSESFHAK